MWRIVLVVGVCLGVCCSAFGTGDASPPEGVWSFSLGDGAVFQFIPDWEYGVWCYQRVGNVDQAFQEDSQAGTNQWVYYPSSTGNFEYLTTPFVGQAPVWDTSFFAGYGGVVGVFNQDGSVWMDPATGHPFGSGEAPFVYVVPVPDSGIDWVGTGEVLAGLMVVFIVGGVGLWLALRYVCAGTSWVSTGVAGVDGVGRCVHGSRGGCDGVVGGAGCRSRWCDPSDFGYSGEGNFPRPHG